MFCTWHWTIRQGDFELKRKKMFARDESWNAWLSHTANVEITPTVGKRAKSVFTWTVYTEIFAFSLVQWALTTWTKPRVQWAVSEFQRRALNSRSWWTGSGRCFCLCGRIMERRETRDGEGERSREKSNADVETDGDRENCHNHQLCHITRWWWCPTWQSFHQPSFQTSSSIALSRPLINIPASLLLKCVSHITSMQWRCIQHCERCHFIHLVLKNLAL